MRLGTPNGLSTARLLKADPSTSKIPTIFIVAGATLDDRLMSLHEGAVDCLPAPFESEELLMRVAVHLALARRAGADALTEGKPVAPEGKNQAEVGAHDADEVLAQAALRIVQDDVANVPALAALAAQVGTHEKRLSRAFRAHTGKTVFEFVRGARLAHARTLLLDSALTVSEVAQAVGFSNAANFSTSFRAHFGAAPTFLRTKDPKSRGQRRR